MDTSMKMQVLEIVARALVEDIGSGDFTTDWTIDLHLTLSGEMLVKQPGVIAGLEVAALAFEAVDPAVDFTAMASDGDRVSRGQVVAMVRGPARPILTAERTALNFLQRMSGIATAARRFVDAVAGTKAIVLDTRKTVPGLRFLDKWAFRLGGGQNHRIGLYDMILIKDNHIAAAGGITAAVQKAQAHNRQRLPVEVEVKSLAELDEALALDVDRIMLDNIPPEVMKQAVARTAGRVKLEASGGVDLTNISRIAATGVDYISVGAATHSPEALDISLDVRFVEGSE